MSRTGTRRRVAAAALAVVLGSCGGGTARTDPTTSAPPATTAWPDPSFTDHLSEYLDPSWTSEPPAALYGPGDMFANHPCVTPEELELEGYVNGKLVVVSADDGAFIDVARSSPESSLWAATPAEVDTVVVVWAFRFQTGVYINGDKMLRLDWGVKVVDFRTKTVVGGAYFSGDNPPRTKYGEGDVTGAAPSADLEVALRARQFAAPFEAARATYVDPAWMQQTPEIDYELGKRLGALDHVTGKVIIVSAETGQLLRPAFADRSASEFGPPDWGLSWATTPDDVGTIVVVWSFDRALRSFPDGTGYRVDYKVRLVDRATGTVIDDAYFFGESPPSSKTCSGDIRGGSPWLDLMESLRSAPAA